MRDEAPTDDAEARRIQAVADHHPGMVGPDDVLAQTTRFAARLCEAPIALVSLVGQDLQEFVARHGLEATSTARCDSFCQFAMAEAALMVVPDARRDARFAGNPLVQGEPHIRFYAGCPLTDDAGQPLGALCVIDREPREGLSDVQAEGLRLLARQASHLLQARRLARQGALAAEAHEVALESSETRFRILADTMPQMVWSTRADGYHDYYNARWYEFTGVPAGSTDGEAWNGMFHPEDQDRAWACWRHSLASGEPYEIEYRLRRADGAYRWTLGRALPMRNSAGRIVRWFGTCTDIHDQRRLLEERQIVSQELSHRIKNIFSIIAGMVSLAARRRPEAAGLAADLRERIIALGRAHDFVRPHSPKSAPQDRAGTLQGMLGHIFAPYEDGEAPRIRMTGDDPEIDDRSATPLALLFHELSTNSAKYGALSAADGFVTLEISTDAEAIAFRWTEQGGPRLDGPPRQEGFGTQLADITATRQLGASLLRNWRAEGLEVEIRFPLSALRRARELRPAGTG